MLFCFNCQYISRMCVWDMWAGRMQNRVLGKLVIYVPVCLYAWVFVYQTNDALETASLEYDCVHLSSTDFAYAGISLGCYYYCCYWKKLHMKKKKFYKELFPISPYFYRAINKNTKVKRISKFRTLTYACLFNKHINIGIDISRTLRSTIETYSRSIDLTSIL
jgi:hypothetical protein